MGVDLRESERLTSTTRQMRSGHQSESRESPQTHHHTGPERSKPQIDRYRSGCKNQPVRSLRPQGERGEARSPMAGHIRTEHERHTPPRFPSHHALANQCHARSQEAKWRCPHQRAQRRDACPGAGGRCARARAWQSRPQHAISHG